MPIWCPADYEMAYHLLPGVLRGVGCEMVMAHDSSLMSGWQAAMLAAGYAARCMCGLMPIW